MEMLHLLLRAVILQLMENTLDMVEVRELPIIVGGLVLQLGFLVAVQVVGAEH